MEKTNTLKKVLTSVHIWAIGVGLVISGEYFGWNYGWQAGGTLGLLIATLIITAFTLLSSSALPN